MRISDWSSDVCSSDLKCKAVSQFVITGLCQTNGGNHEIPRLPAGPFGVCCGVASSFPIGCSEGDGQGLAGTGEDPDRTGVVSVKSVSVRVDLGCCRYIKKQNTHSIKAIININT